MQWKIPFSEYFESDSSKISKIASEYSSNLEEMVPTSGLIQNKYGLTKEQKAVIDRFPTPLDTTDQNWQKMEELVKAWDNKRQIWSIAYNMKAIAVANGLSAFLITHSFRRAFKLADGKTGILNTYVPSMGLPLFFGSILHYKLITAPIVAGIDDCRLCRGLTAGLIQSVSAILYPMLFSSISSIYFANYFMTYPIPEDFRDKSSRKYLIEILKKTIKRNKIGLICLTALNFGFAFYLTQSQYKTTEFMYFSLLTKEYMKSNKNKIQ